MNITHIINLFRAYFIENKKTLLISCLISFGILTFAHTINAMPELAPIAPFAITLWLAGNFFQSSLKKNNCTHFFNLPVTTCEKFTHAIVTLAVFGIIIHFLALAGAYAGYYVVHPLLNTDINETRWLINGKMDIWGQYCLNWHIISYYIAAIVTFLFGSIYFRRWAFLKSIGWGLGFSFGISFYALGLIYIAFGSMSSSNNVSINIANGDFLYEHWYIFPIAIIVFFLSLTYLRLKETEV